MTTNEATTRRRVKLYMLNTERQWDDKGTGHVSALLSDQHNMALVVISESDGTALLESKILQDTAYHKQQQTLIVWSEGEHSDLALSFQEKSGCDDIWEKICTVQGKDPSVEVTQEVVDESDEGEDSESYSHSTVSGGQAFELPPCELSRLEDLCELVSQASQMPVKRERFVAALERTDYLSKLVDLFHRAEDLKAEEALNQLFEIIRHIILFNKPSLYETLFSDNMLMDVIGMLEYSPSGRTRHRDFLLGQAQFKEVLQLSNQSLVSKIHQTYRVQYIQDCCLPPPCLFDEHTLSALKNFVQASKFDIIWAIQDDDEFMRKMFASLGDESSACDQTGADRRRDLALLAKEFCALSVQSDNKEGLLQTMHQHGALRTVESMLRSSDREVKGAGMDILHAFVENQATTVREHIYQDCGRVDAENLLINIMIQQMINDTDPEMSDAAVLSWMIRLLIDPENMSNVDGHFARGEKTDFLNFFYRHCVYYLTKPLFDNTMKEAPLHDDYRHALVMHHILDLLTFCFENHGYQMRNYCFHRDLIKRVLILLRSEHRFLVLDALRLLRRVIGLNEEFYARYLIKNSLFKPVIDLFLRNGHRYNLIDSAIIELFHHIRTEDMTSLISHIVENYWDILRSVDYVSTFRDLKQVYDSCHRRSRYEAPSPAAIHHNPQSQLDVLSLVGGNVTSPLRTGAATPFGPALTAAREVAHRAASVATTNGSRFFDRDDDMWYEQSDEEDEVPSSPPVASGAGTLTTASNVANPVVQLSKQSDLFGSSVLVGAPSAATTAAAASNVQAPGESEATASAVEFKSRAALLGASSDEDDEDDAFDHPMRKLQVRNPLKQQNVSQIAINIRLHSLATQKLTKQSSTAGESEEAEQTGEENSPLVTAAKTATKRVAAEGDAQSKRAREDSPPPSSSEAKQVEAGQEPPSKEGGEEKKHRNEEEEEEATETGASPRKSEAEQPEGTRSPIGSLVEYSDEEEEEESPAVPPPTAPDFAESS